MGEKLYRPEEEAEKVPERKLTPPEQCFEKLKETYGSLAEKINTTATYSGFFKKPIMQPLPDDYPPTQEEMEFWLENMVDSVLDGKHKLERKDLITEEGFQYPEEKKLALLRREMFDFLNEQERNEQVYFETKEKFGENFLGLDEVEKAFSLYKGRKLVEFTPVERQEAQRLLLDFLQQPDVKEFMEKIDSRRTDPSRWLMYLEMPQVSDGNPLTIDFLQNVIGPDMENRFQGPLLSPDSEQNYSRQSFYGNDTMPLRWRLSTTDVILGTRGVGIHTQRSIQQDFARDNGLNFAPGNSKVVDLERNRASASHPLETVYRYMLQLRTSGKSFLRGAFDRTIYEDVMVGGGPGSKKQGLIIAPDPGRGHPDIGLSFSR